MTDSAAGRLRAARSHTSPVRRRPGEATAGAAGHEITERKVRITVDLPESLHRALKIHLARHGVDGGSYVRALLVEALADELNDS